MARIWLAPFAMHAHAVHIDVPDDQETTYREAFALLGKEVLEPAPATIVVRANSAPQAVGGPP